MGKMMTGWRDKINNGDPMWRIEDWINSIPLFEDSIWICPDKWKQGTKPKSRTFSKNITQNNKSKTLISPFYFYVNPR